MPLLTGREIARRSAGGRMDLRTEPSRLRINLRELSAFDSHMIELTLTCSVIALDQHAEREMLAETFLSGRDAVTIDDVAEHFSRGVRDAMSREIATKPVDEWLGETS